MDTQYGTVPLQGENPMQRQTAPQREVEEKFGEQNFRVWSEMRILIKIRVVILDFVEYVDFRVLRHRFYGLRLRVLSTRFQILG